MASTPLKNISQLELLFPMYEKMIMFQTTNQAIIAREYGYHHRSEASEGRALQKLAELHQDMAVSPVTLRAVRGFTVTTVSWLIP